MFNSETLDVIPSKAFNSEAVAVTPSKMFNSSGVDVICVVEAAARTGNVPDTFGNDIVLIEWPDRLGYLEPQDALTIELVILENDKREVIFSTSSCVWEARLEKTLQK